MQNEIQQGKVSISPSTGPLTRTVGIGYGRGTGGCRRAVREAIDELGFDLGILQSGGALDLWFESPPDTPFEQFLPGIRTVHDAVGASIVGEIILEVDDDLDGEFFVELVVWTMPTAGQNRRR